jgi:hypothetical protein
LVILTATTRDRKQGDTMRTQALEDEYLFVSADEEEIEEVAENSEDNGFNIWQLLIPLNA